MVERVPGDEGFLRRWSRRKAQRASEPAPADAPADQVPEAADAASPPAEADAPFDVASLPDIETMDAGADFKAFMQQGVPKELRTMALRKLWRLNPTYSHLDGLVDYGEDYRAAGTLAGKLKTAYQVGKGFVRDEEPPADATPAPASPPSQQVDARPQTARIEAAAEPPVEAALEPATGESTDKPASGGAPGNTRS